VLGLSFHKNSHNQSACYDHFFRLETSYRQRASFLQELGNPFEELKECYERALKCRRCNIALVSYAAHLSGPG
jgi:hypothetical protein